MYFPFQSTKAEDIYMPTFVEHGADVSKIDLNSKPKFNWEWTRVEYIIEVNNYGLEIP